MTARELIAKLEKCEDMDDDLEIYTLDHEPLTISWFDKEGIMWIKKEGE
jgi:hypothetical protein